MSHFKKLIALGLSLASLAAAQGAGPTQAELNAADTSTNSWLMMNKGYSGQRHVALTQINTSNASRLHPLCTFNTGEPGPFQATPQVYRGVMYIVKEYKTYAVSATNCNLLWTNNYKPHLAHGVRHAPRRGALQRHGHPRQQQRPSVRVERPDRQADVGHQGGRFRKRRFHQLCPDRLEQHGVHGRGRRGLGASRATCTRTTLAPASSSGRST